MSNTLHAFDFLESTPDIPQICVLFGDEPLLKTLVRRALRDKVFGGDTEAPFSMLEGGETDWRDVSDEISTVSLFGSKSKRLVVVQDADSFVTKNRSQLEDYVEKPRRTGVLVLEVGSWASNTRLYKAIDRSGLQVDCRMPQKGGKKNEIDEGRLAKWLVGRAKSEHGATLELAAAKRLIELVGPELGMLDNDLAKLALFVKVKEKITAQLVDDIVGGWRAKTIWEVVDAAADGDAREALVQLDRLLHSGEPPLALFGQIAWSLRRYAIATRVVQRAERKRERITLRDALLQAGFRQWPPEQLSRAENQLKQLGRDRAGKMLEWLLEADLAMKGSHSAPDRARFVLEKLFLRMAKRPAASLSN